MSSYLYLGKSNLANQSFVSIIKDRLIYTPYKEHKDNEVYDENKLKLASFCIMILSSVELGKGVFEQIVLAKQLKIPIKLIFPYTTVEGIRSIYVMDDNFAITKSKNSNDYVNWGRISNWGNYKRFDFSNEGYSNALDCIRSSQDYEKFMTSVRLDKEELKQMEQGIVPEIVKEKVFLTTSHKDCIAMNKKDHSAVFIDTSAKENPKLPNECFTVNYKHLLLRRRK